jgi:hypothetical protein
MTYIASIIGTIIPRFTRYYKHKTFYFVVLQIVIYNPWYKNPGIQDVCITSMADTQMLINGTTLILSGNQSCIVE